MDAAALTAGLCALALLHPRAREKAAAWWEAIDDAEPERVARFVRISSAAVGAWVILLKSVQYLGFQYHMDTVSMVNAAANFLSGRGLACPALGTPTLLSVHFAFFVPVFLAPVLLLWRSALPLLLIQGAALASCGPAAYLLARRRTGSAMLGLIAMALAWSHISFHELVTSNLDSVLFGPPLLLWGLALWDAERRGAAAVLWALALTTKEQFPFTLAGLGAYHALAADRAWRRRALEGGAIIAGSAALWFLEMRLVASFSDRLNDQMYWTQYASLGASRQDVVRTVLTRPDRVLSQMFWPPSHLGPFVLLLAGTAFFPLASPAALAALVIAGIPHLLLPVYIFHEHYASYTYGPLLFATACGLAALSRRFLKLTPQRLWLLPPTLLAMSVSLFFAPRTVRDVPGNNLPAEAPPLLRFIPADASVWADHNVAVHLAARPQMKNFYGRTLADRFDVLLFRPEYVLVQKVALLSLTAFDQARIAAFLAREGYAKVAESQTLVLLKDPTAPRGGPSPLLAIPRRPDDDARAAPFLAALLDSARARETLASYPPDLRYAPETADQQVSFARVLSRRGFPGLAASHNRAAIAMRPDDPEAHTNLGNALAELGDLQGAEKELREALRIQPDEAMTTSCNLANVLIQERNPAGAIAILEGVEHGGKADARAMNSLGAAYLLSGRREDARDAFQKALAIDPRLEQARENLEQLLRSQARR